MSKGSKQRPTSKSYADNYDAIFNKDTQDETFRRLARRPYEEVDAALKQNGLELHEAYMKQIHHSLQTILTEKHWTREEYDKEMTVRNNVLNKTLSTALAATQYTAAQAQQNLLNQAVVQLNTYMHPMLPPITPAPPPTNGGAMKC